MDPGTIVQLNALKKRDDLNGETALLTSKVLENGRHQAIVLKDDAKPEIIYVFPDNYTVSATDARARASAWNELASQFIRASNYTNGLDAVECALRIASVDASECRIEGCDALALMAWLGLRMSNEGVEFEQGERKAGDLVQFSLENIFSEIIHNKDVVTESTSVQMGAGRIPSRNDPVLLLSLTTNDVSRYFFYDDIEKVVHECVQKTDKEVGKKMEEPCTINGAPVPAPNADDVPSAPEERQAEMPGKE